MKEQQIILKNIDSFEPKHIFECGQCFRWDLNTDGSYTGIVRKNILNVRKQGESVIITGVGNEDFNDVVCNYFDLEVGENFYYDGMQYSEGIIKVDNIYDYITIKKSIFTYIFKN